MEEEATINARTVTVESQLAELGYKQELLRKLSIMSILGLSFATMVSLRACPINSSSAT